MRYQKEKGAYESKTIFCNCYSFRDLFLNGLSPVSAQYDLDTQHEVLSEGNLVMKSTKTRGSGSMLLIRFRQSSEAEHSEYEILRLGNAESDAN